MAIIKARLCRHLMFLNFQNNEFGKVVAILSVAILNKKSPIKIIVKTQLIFTDTVSLLSCRIINSLVVKSKNIF